MSDSTRDLISKLNFGRSNRVRMIRQTESSECGLACLAMIADFHGYKVDMTALRQKFLLSIAGVRLSDLIAFAETLKFSHRALRIEINDLKNLQTPCLLHWDLNHFVVLTSANKNNITINDPACGERKISYKEASKHFTGVALELSPTKEFERKDEKETLKLSDFWTDIVGLKNYLIIILVLSLFLQMFALAAPYYMQIAVDDVIVTNDLPLLSILALGFLGLLFFEIFTSVLRGISLLHLSNLLNLQLGRNLFHHLIRLPIKYFESRHMGDIVSRFGSLQQVKQLLTSGIIEAIIDGLMAVVTLAMLIFYSGQLTLIVLVAVTAYVLLRLAMFRSLRDVSEKEILARANESSNYMETIRGIQTIKLFNAESKREGIWQNYYVEAINHSIKLGHYSITYGAIERFIFGVENVLIIYVAVQLVLSGQFSVGMLFAYLAYKGQFVSKASALVGKLIEFKMLGLHFERLADIALNKKEEIDTEEPNSQPIKGKISLTNVSFRYDDTSTNVIDNFSLNIETGESVAISGPSGCGKSTLMKLMLGLHKPNEGSIFVDDQPLEKVGIKHYRKQIASVMQNDELLSGSLAENIAFFDEHIDMDKVIKCAQFASIHQDIVNMPMGYNSLIGDMGSSLSGGQKQRVIIARALYSEPRILFMDEATSHLDSKLEKSISQAIKELKITRVIIAHRQETIETTERRIMLT